MKQEIIGLLLSLGVSALASPAAADDDRGHHHRHGLRRIQHIIFIVKENRTFDNYFGTFPGADGATTGMIHTGEIIPLSRQPDRLTHDIGHSFNNAVTAINGGAMNQFDLITGGQDLSGYSQYLEERSEEHTSELQSPDHLVCRLLLEKKKQPTWTHHLCSDPNEQACNVVHKHA